MGRVEGLSSGRRQTAGGAQVGIGAAAAAATRTQGHGLMAGTVGSGMRGGGEKGFSREKNKEEVSDVHRSTMITRGPPSMRCLMAALRFAEALLLFRHPTCSAICNLYHKRGRAREDHMVEQHPAFQCTEPRMDDKLRLVLCSTVVDGVQMRSSKCRRQSPCHVPKSSSLFSSSLYSTLP